MKKVILLLVAMIPLFASAQIKFPEMKLEDAMKKAAAEGKGIMVDVISGRVDEKSLAKIFLDKELEKNVLQNFIVMRVDVMKPNNEYILQYIENVPYPCVVFLSAKGERLATGFWDAMASGYHNVNEVYKTAIDNAADKKLNTRKLEFRNISYDEALAAAKKEDKPIFIFCSMKGCGPCRQMENDVFTINSVADCHNKNFICIKSMRETDDVAEKYNVRGFPTMIYLDATGKLSVREDGFKTREQLLEMAKQTIEGDQSAVKSVPMMESINATTNGSSGTASSASSSSSSSAAATVPQSAMAMAPTAATKGKINFEKLTLTQAKEKAVKENKVIYVDLSATWCGPCQQMKKTTFNDDVVADYMNKNFISICFECDIDETLSMEYRDKYRSTAFPTHLLIDSKGELIHKFVGFHPSQTFMEELKKAVSGAKGLGYYTQKYKDGERSSEFMGEYITLLAKANEGAAASELASGYLDALPLDQLTTPQNFMLVYEFVRDISSPVAQKIIKNKDKVIKSIGQSDYDTYLYMLWTIKADSYIKEIDGKRSYDEKGFDECMKEMNATGFSKAKDIQLGASVRNILFMKDWTSFLKITSDYMSKNKGNANSMLTCNWGLDLVKVCDDKATMKKYAELLGDNFELVKNSGNEDAYIWEESMKCVIDDLTK